MRIEYVSPYFYNPKCSIMTGKNQQGNYYRNALITTPCG